MMREADIFEPAVAICKPPETVSVEKYMDMRMQFHKEYAKLNNPDRA